MDCAALQSPHVATGSFATFPSQSSEYDVVLSGVRDPEQSAARKLQGMQQTLEQSVAAPQGKIKEQIQEIPEIRQGGIAAGTKGGRRFSVIRGEGPMDTVYTVQNFRSNTESGCSVKVKGGRAGDVASISAPTHDYAMQRFYRRSLDVRGKEASGTPQRSARYDGFAGTTADPVHRVGAEGAERFGGQSPFAWTPEQVEQVEESGGNVCKESSRHGCGVAAIHVENYGESQTACTPISTSKCRSHGVLQCETPRLANGQGGGVNCLTQSHQPILGATNHGRDARDCSADGRSPEYIRRRRPGRVNDRPDSQRSGRGRRRYDRGNEYQQAKEFAAGHETLQVGSLPHPGSKDPSQVQGRQDQGGQRDKGFIKSYGFGLDGTARKDRDVVHVRAASWHRLFKTGTEQLHKDLVLRDFFPG